MSQLCILNIPGYRPANHLSSHLAATISEFSIYVNLNNIFKGNKMSRKIMLRLYFIYIILSGQRRQCRKQRKFGSFVSYKIFYDKSVMDEPNVHIQYSSEKKLQFREGSYFISYNSIYLRCHSNFRCIFLMTLPKVEYSKYQNNSEFW